MYTVVHASVATIALALASSPNSSPAVAHPSVKSILYSTHHVPQTHRTSRGACKYKVPWTSTVQFDINQWIMSVRYHIGIALACKMHAVLSINIDVHAHLVS